MKSRRSFRTPTGHAGRALLFCACLLLSQAQSHALGGPQGALQDDHSVTKELLIRSLEVGVDPDKRMPAAYYIERIRERGVKFLVTPSDERRIRNVGKYLGPAELNKLINALRDNYRPAISMLGKVEQVKVAANPGGGVLVFVKLMVRNYGPPTVARKYALRIMHTTSANIDFNAAPVTLDEPFTVTEGGKSEEVTIQPTEALTLKTGRALSTGETVIGWLKFYLPPMPQTKAADQLKPETLREHGIWYVMSFVDVSGNLYEDIFKVN